jgi:streptogramin lyase
VSPPLAGPQSIVLDSAGNLYVADNGAKIVKVTPSGAATTITTNCDTCGGGNVSMGNALAIDSSDNLYLADASAVFKITQAGKVTTFAGSTCGGGTLVTVAGVAIDGSCNVYAADSSNNEVYKISPTGSIHSFASLTNPVAIAVDASGNVYVVASQASNEIYKITPAGTSSKFATCTLNGGASSCELSTLAVDKSGNIYALDTTAGTVGLVKASGGAMTDLFAMIPFPHDAVAGNGMAVDAAGDVFFSGENPATILEEEP